MPHFHCRFNICELWQMISDVSPYNADPKGSCVVDLLSRFREMISGKLGLAQWPLHKHECHCWESSEIGSESSINDTWVNALRASAVREWGQRGWAEKGGEGQWSCIRTTDDSTVSMGAGMALPRGPKLRQGTEAVPSHQTSPHLEAVPRDEGNSHGQGCSLSPELFLERDVAASQARQQSSSWRNACLSPVGAVCLGSTPAPPTIHHCVIGALPSCDYVYSNLVNLLQHPARLLLQGKLPQESQWDGRQPCFSI